MKLLLIWPKGGETFPALMKKAAFFYPLNLPIIAACTPKSYEVQIIDDHIESFNSEIDVDLVAINVLTHNSKRAYEISEFFRKKSVKVVLGGMHVNLLPEEAMGNADSIVTGNAEHIWKDLLKDFEMGSLKKIYESSYGFPQEYVIPRRDLLDKKSFFQIPTMEATRGCPNSCHFCSVGANYKTRYFCRDTSSIKEEIQDIGSKRILFLDDNLTANKAFAKSLFQELSELEINWGAQVSLDCSKDDELLKLMSDCGCSYVFIGLETISQKNLRDYRKICNLYDYQKAIAGFHKHDIAIYGSFIFGLDHDDVTVFEKTVEFAKNNCIEVAAFSIFTPLPGTKTFGRMLKEGRIFNFDWQNYDFRNVVFTPNKMSASDLQQGYHWAWDEYYSFKATSRRLLKMKHKALMFPINIGYGFQAIFSNKETRMRKINALAAQSKINKENNICITGGVKNAL